MPVTFAMNSHVWNKDRSRIAFIPAGDENEVHIYSYQEHPEKMTLINKLAEHDMRVTGLDWAPNTNRIVTCSADRNAFVWTQDANGKWTTTLVLLRINRAATCVKWSPSENKFAVGSGDKTISICYYEKKNNWWVSKHIKEPIHSTVTCLDWHPNNILLVAGSADFKVRVFSAYIKDIEDRPEPNVWGTKLPLGQLLAEFPNSPSGGGWVHSVSFSDDGNKIAWVAHDSSINVADATQEKAVSKLKTAHPPFLLCTWVTNDCLIVAGHNCFPLLYFYNGNGTNGESFHFISEAKGRKKVSGELSAMEKFQALDRQGRVDNRDIDIDSVHQKCITCINLYKGTKANTTEFTTSSFDGGPRFWDINTSILDTHIPILRLVLSQNNETQQD